MAETASPLRVLHLAGSPESQFYHDLSLLYAGEVVKPDGFESSFAVIGPDLLWRMGEDPECLTQPLPIEEVLPAMRQANLIVNHLFCPTGVTSYRSLFEEILKKPVVGSDALVQGTAMDKSLTKARLAAAGLPVVPGEVVLRGEQPDPTGRKYPLIVKPATTDNSVGLSLVESADDFAGAIQQGWVHDSTLLIEDFIPGREIRTCAIEQDDGSLYVPAMMEYLVSEDEPIRKMEDKLDLDPATGLPTDQSSRGTIPAQCPADLDETLREQLADLTRRSHRALGCRDFSLFDFRVHEDTGEAFVLEAGLFWAFGEISMISRMVVADGRDLREEVAPVWRRVAGGR